MAQTAAAYSGRATTISLNSTNISGSANRVSSTEQRRGSGDGYAFSGDVAIIKKGGKRQPVEISFGIVYTEETAEAWEIAKALFETAGGGVVTVRWVLESGATVWMITNGVMTRLTYPPADPTDANPVVCEFSVRAAKVTGDSLPSNLLAIDPQTLLEDFETVGDWTAGGGCSLAANTSQYFSGTQSIQMTTDVGVKGTMTKTVSLDLYSLLNVRFWFYTPDLDKIQSVGIVLGQNAGVTVAFEKYLGYGSPVNYFASRLQVNRADWTVWSADWANPIIRLRFSITPKTGQIAVGSFDYCTAGVVGTPCAFVSFDDEHESVHDHAYPHMAANGQRGTAYVITDLVGNANKMSWTELQALNAAGWDIGNHTKDHTNLTTLTYAQQLAELQDAQAALVAQGLARAADQVAYPYGAYNDDTLAAMAAAGMKTGRTVENAAPDIMPFANPYRLQVYCYLTDTLSLAQAKAKVDTAKASGAILSVLGHILVVSGPGSNEWTIQDFRDLMDYIRDEGLPCVTASDLYNLQSAAIMP